MLVYHVAVSSDGNTVTVELEDKERGGTTTMILVKQQYPVDVASPGRMSVEKVMGDGENCAHIRRWAG